MIALVVIFGIVTLCAGIFAANRHREVLGSVANAFGRILAFVVGAGLAGWACSLLLGFIAWASMPSRHREFSDLGGLILLHLGILVAFILSLGLITTLVDIRENIRQLAAGSPGGNAHRPKPGGSSQKYDRILQDLDDSPSELLPAVPEYTDEEKAEIAREAARMVPKTGAGEDEERATDP